MKGGDKAKGPTGGWQLVWRDGPSELDQRDDTWAQNPERPRQYAALTLAVS